jgi:hypothetical protein
MSHSEAIGFSHPNKVKPRRFGASRSAVRASGRSGFVSLLVVRLPCREDAGREKSEQRTHITTGVVCLGVRKAILFLLYGIMIVGGGYALALQLVFAEKLRFLFVGGTGAVMALGLYMLWTDFIGPAFGFKEEE